MYLQNQTDFILLNTPKAKKDRNPIILNLYKDNTNLQLLNLFPTYPQFNDSQKPRIREI
ncbi:hypothetical protein NIES46_05670 [Arthrospira platensis NIES-46]|uniref:Uncharacterized protein n=1 Tax=Limnospira platensis NIES-46 TaxID=1236695 RepID=A0A5M3T143_LIMPL|nr:hypothetical protein NIES46_05670 [Arthrospira platensis NIES-46]